MVADILVGKRLQLCLQVQDKRLDNTDLHSG